MKTNKKTQYSESIEVLFQNNKYSIETYINKNTNKISIVVIKDKIRSEFPIRYSNGHVVYDNPYILPFYIKNKVKKYFNNLIV